MTSRPRFVESSWALGAKRLEIPFPPNTRVHLPHATFREPTPGPVPAGCKVTQAMYGLQPGPSSSHYVLRAFRAFRGAGFR